MLARFKIILEKDFHDPDIHSVAADPKEEMIQTSSSVFGIEVGIEKTKRMGVYI